MSRLFVALGATVLGAVLTGCGSDEPAADDEQAAPSSSAPAGLTQVVIGDSIPNNLSTDCPGCTGFADSYGAAVEKATGQAVEVQNFSEHTGLTLEGLLDSLPNLESYLAEADVIVVGIAHNSLELNSDKPCGAPLTDQELPVWSKLDRACAVASAKKYRPKYDELFSRVAELRDGKPTLLRTINRYNDWIGWPEGDLTPDQERLTKVFLDTWNSMICSSAEEHGFGCADVYHAFNGPQGLRPSGRLVADDYTHPSQDGNDRITRVLDEMGYAPLA